MKFSLNCLMLMLMLLSLGEASSQEAMDTLIQIKEVTVTASNIKNDNNVGGRTTRIKSSVIESNHTQSIAELLSENTTIYIKTLGQGAMATSSFRGTSSNHTQVNWNCLNINSLTLGNLDFSQIPAFFTDEVTLHHGSGYSKNGSGALGGSINLNNSEKEFAGRPAFRVLTEYGANNTFTTGVSAMLGNKKLTSNSRVYYQQSDNDFRYLNKVLSKDPFYDRRTYADYNQLGLMQEFYFKLDDNKRLSLNVWYQKDKRNLPPPVHVYISSKESQQTDDLRSYLNYSQTSGKHQFGATVSFLQNRFQYERKFDISLGDTYSDNRNSSYILKGDYQYNLSPELMLNNTTQYRVDRVRTVNYSGSSISEQRLHTQFAVRWTPVSALTTDLQVSGELSNGQTAGTYSAGASYYLIEGLLLVKGNHAYNHRFPTLNDRFWNPGGNPNLKPEKGFSSDLTTQVTPKFGPVRLRGEFTYFLMNIQDWITWVPTENSYIWEALNFSKVRSTGAEVLAEAMTDWGATSHQLSFTYGFTSSLDRTNRKDGTEGKQLPYVPRNKWNARYSFQIKGFKANYRTMFTDVRYTSTDESYTTNEYLIHDIDFSYGFKLKRVNVQTALRVNNLLNAYHESTQYYPMPLRTWHFSILTTF